MKLWVRAGGRCELCNQYLLEDEATGIAASLEDIAHVVARSRKGPRGNDPLPLSERNKVENLMLLCSKDHNKLIDRRRLIPEFPKERLLKAKEEHESRIRYLTDLGPERETAVIRMIGQVRGDIASISKDEIRKTVWQCENRFPQFLGIDNVVDISLDELPEEGTKRYWMSGISKIDENIQRIALAKKRKEINVLSVFALARIPLLVYLGFRLPDKIPTTIYQKHRDGDEGWSWRQGTKTIDFHWSQVSHSNTQSRVAIVISASGRIALESLPHEIQRDGLIYEIGPSGIAPGRNILTNLTSLESFRKTYQELLRTIEKNQKKDTVIHLFAAVPAPIGLTCGREILKNVTPPMWVYDRIGNQYIKTIQMRST